MVVERRDRFPAGSKRAGRIGDQDRQQNVLVDDRLILAIRERVGQHDLLLPGDVDRDVDRSRRMGGQHHHDLLPCVDRDVGHRRAELNVIAAVNRRTDERQTDEVVTFEVDEDPAAGWSG